MFPIGIESYSALYGGAQLYVYIFISLANAVLLFFASLKFMLALQQGGYKFTRYFKWVGSPETPYFKRLMLLSLLGLLFFCVLNMCFAPILGEHVASYVGFVAYVLFGGLYISSEKSVNVKVPLKKTKRLIRLSVTYILVLAGVTFCIIALVNYIAFAIGDEVVALLRYLPVCLLPMLMPFLLFIAYCLNEPFEEVLRRHYVKVATIKLDRSSVIKIGITGSYGKTSVKEILTTILSQKYRVLSTPASYNTPLGISIAVKRLDSTHDIFIAEMGARYKGDIKHLVKIVKPQYGVLTGVNNQHLETFGSIDVTKDTKFELFEGMSTGGKGFFCSDSEGAVELYGRFNGEKHLAGLNGSCNLVTAEDITMGSQGMSFKLCIKGEEPVRCTTMLLGKHSVSNICLAASLAYELGLTVEEIALGINRIKTVGHRLQLMPNNKGIVIIDDSYNSNVDGTKSAMEVLDTFEGRKIVLTPGLVELGRMENVANMEFGKLLAQHADLVFVIGKHNAEMLVSGLLEGGMSRENIRYAKSLNKANEELNEILKEGDVVLFENDLPDNYN